MGLNLYRPLHFIFGEYVFETDTKSFVLLANLLTQKRLHFWHTENDNDKIRFRSSVFLAEEIVKTANDSAIPLEIVRKHGIPFLFSRYRKRYGLILGFVLGLFLLFYSQLFVWKVNVDGNVDLTVPEIERALADCGIAVGSYIPDINVERDSNLLLMSHEEISSAAISINGTHLTVTVLETKLPPEIVNTAGFYNVVAERDGVILDIDAADGSPAVSEGDAVFKGELLINSFIEGTNGTYRPTHARGIVYAAVEESFVSEVPLSRVTKDYTGKTETKRVIYIMGQKMPSISSPETSFEYFDAVSAEKQIKLFGFIELPVKVFKAVYSEYVLSEQPITPQYAELLANQELDGFLADFDSEVLSCETEFTVDEKNGVCILSANAVIKQNIAKEVPFEIDYYNISERLPKASE